MNINSYELNIQIVELVFFCDCVTRFRYFRVNVFAVYFAIFKYFRILIFQTAECEKYKEKITQLETQRNAQVEELEATKLRHDSEIGKIRF